MAPRQRFIHPSIWKDPIYGRMCELDQLLFIGFFSIADDDGRLLADPDFLKAEIFPYAKFTAAKVKKSRDAICSTMPSVHLYKALEIEYIALLKWTDYQKPKYPKPSKIPAPFPQASPKTSPELEAVDKTSDPWVGLGRDGMGEGLGLGEDLNRHLEIRQTIEERLAS